MLVTKNEFCKLSKLSIDNVSKESVTELFAIYNSSEIYILDKSKLVGLVTRGDYLRSLDSNEININRNYKYLIESSNSVDESKTIFYKFKNINSIPIVDKDGNLLYSYSYNYRGYISEWESDSFLETYLSYLMSIIDVYNLTPPLYEYFKLNKFNNLFIFGNDYLCNIFSNELRNIDGINILDIVTKTKIRANINNRDELLYKIHKADVLVMADFRYFDEYKILFDHINIKKVSIWEILMTYTTLESITKLFRNIQLLKTNLSSNKCNVRFYYFRFPKSQLVKNPSKNENFLLNDIRNNKEALKKPDNLYYEPELFNYVPHIKKGNTIFHQDFKSKYVNIINGYRITTDNPDNYENTIYIFGSSVAFSWGSEDKYTISSCLQRIVKSQFNNKYRVLNCGINSMWDKEVLNHINNTKFKSGDIAIIINTYHDFMVRKYTSQYNIMDNLQPIFDRPHNLDEVFVDNTHMNWVANQKIAEKIFESAICDTIEKNTLNLDKIESLDDLNLKYYKKSSKFLFDDNPELLKYLAELKKQKVDIEGKVGSIVVNCNPFTLGHLYLIEKSASMVDFLYIFVVEEENPHFPFKDRFELVKKGTKHIKNVKVIPSGKFLVSVLTFPEYFDKDSNPNILTDPSTDIESFARYIAPTLDIKVRFVGEEPIDYITHQYNTALKSILPKYGIQLIEFPRKNFESNPISASIVRKLLKENEFNKLKSLIPDTTYEYLLKISK